MCLRPRVITYQSRLNKNSDSGIVISGMKHSVLIQCGKCEECVKQYQNDWMIRCIEELKDKKVAVFFTLTYSDENVPIGSVSDEKECLTVCRDDCKKFLKRFREYRRKRGFSTDYTYYFTSEYGPTTLRPHYHCLLFGVRLSECLPFLSSWRKKYGFTTQREVNILSMKSAMNTARYTAKYCAKGDFENPLVALNLVESNFHLISKGLGSSYLTPEKYAYHLALDFPNKFRSFGEYTDSYLEQIYNRMRVQVGQYSYHMPRYYKTKIFEHKAYLQAAYSDYVCKRILDLYEGKLEQLQASNFVGSRDSAVRVVYAQDIADLKQRQKDSVESLSKHFKQSKI